MSPSMSRLPSSLPTHVRPPSNTGIATATAATRTPTTADDNTSLALTPAANAEMDDDTEKLDPFLEIWDSALVEKTTNAIGEEGWKCHHCMKFFKVVNATKALAHVTATPKKNIARCMGVISSLYASAYLELKLLKLGRKDNRVRNREELDVSIEEDAEQTLTRLPEKKRPRRRGGTTVGCASVASKGALNS